MKKITLFILALGLTIGAIAQVKDASNLTPMKVNVAPSLIKDYTMYPSSFETYGLTTDDAMLYFSDIDQIYTGVSGTNYWVDNAYAQVYNVGWNVPIKGIAAVLGQITLTTTGTQVKAALHSATSTTIGNEVSFVNFNSNTASDLASTGELGLATFTLPAIQNMSNFAVVITVPEFELNATQDEIISDFLFVGTTEIDKASGEKSFSYSYVDETGTTRAWASVLSAWDIDLDMMIFPIIDGTGLNNVDVNSLSYVYPNPAKDQITFASSFNMERVEIFNMLGQKVYENKVNGIATTVDVSNLNNGTYMVKIFTEAGLATKKIVVE